MLIYAITQSKIWKICLQSIKKYYNNINTTSPVAFPAGHRASSEALVFSTIITSQLPIKLWHEAVGDPTLADAILDRLFGGTLSSVSSSHHA